MEDISNHIPCELCQELIHIDNFQDHTNSCIMSGGAQLLFNMVENSNNLSFNNMTQLINMNVEPEREENRIFSNNYYLNENLNSNSDIEGENPQGRDNQPEIFQNISREIVDNIISNILGVSNSNNENLSESLERVGVVEKVIDNIEEVSCLVSNDKKVNCPICQAECKAPVRKTLCNHSFCNSCISQWLSKSKKCPSCMQDLEELLKEKN